MGIPSIKPIAKGLPGLMATLHKIKSPSEFKSFDTKSLSPAEAPPVVIIKSNFPLLDFIFDLRPSSQSLTIPKSEVLCPQL